MNLTETYLLLFVMLAIVAVVSVLFKGKNGLISPMIFVAGLITALVAGMGFRLREVTEGPFVYVDNLMWVLCGAIFVYALYLNGTFQFLFDKWRGAKLGPVARLFVLILFLGLPGMLTGTALASVATTGLIVGRYLLDKGIEKTKVVEVVTMGSLFGMLLPPLCVPAMAFAIARQGLYPASFEGFFLPILVLTLPALIVYCALSGRRLLEGADAEEQVEKKGGAVCLIPLLVVAVLVICHNFLYFVMPFLGYPVIYVIGFVLALIFKCQGVNALTTASEGIRTVAIELAMILAFASAIEVFNTVGVNGTLAAQIKIAGVNSTLMSLVFALLLLVGGAVLGTPFAYTLGAVAVYQVSNANYTTGSELLMMALGVTVALTMLLSLRGGIADSVCQQLGVAGVTGPGIAKRNVITVLLLLVAVVVFLCASGLSVLMI